MSRATCLAALLTTALLMLTSPAHAETLLAQAQTQPAEEMLANSGPAFEADTSLDPFAQGEWYAHTYGSATFGLSDSDDGNLYLGHVGVGYFFLDDWSINVEGVFGGVDPDTGTADTAVGLDLLFRWHFFTSDDHALSLFGEAGAGLIWFDSTFPATGTHQNFTPQAGLGVMWEVIKNVNLLGGVRWHHVSNANKTGADRNPGYDGVMVFGGLTCTW